MHEAPLKPGARAGAIGPADYGLGSEVLEGLPAEEIARRQTVGATTKQGPSSSCTRLCTERLDDTYPPEGVDEPPTPHPAGVPGTRSLCRAEGDHSDTVAHTHMDM